MSKSVYKLWKETSWGETLWFLAAPNCSPFGRYETKAEALKDAKRYGLKIDNTTRA